VPVVAAVAFDALDALVGAAVRAAVEPGEELPPRTVPRATVRTAPVPVPDTVVPVPATVVPLAGGWDPSVAAPVSDTGAGVDEHAARVTATARAPTIERFTPGDVARKRSWASPERVKRSRSFTYW